MRQKFSGLLRFLGACAAAVGLLLIVVLRVTHGGADGPAPRARPAPPPTPPPAGPGDCRASRWAAAAADNGTSLDALPFAPYRRVEAGWAAYAPLIAREIGTSCPPDSEGFAAAFARWQASQRLPADGRVKESDFLRMKGVVETRRPFVRLMATGICPAAAAEVVEARKAEGYAGKPIALRPDALAAYRRMVAAAKAESPAIGRDPYDLTIFSGYRGPDEEAARCAQRACDGKVRASCSAHRTGTAVDLYVGHAPGLRPDSSDDANRRVMVTTPAYRWLLANGHRFGFVNYPFEPWHWEWTGDTS